MRDNLYKRGKREEKEKEKSKKRERVLPLCFSFLQTFSQLLCDC